MTSRRSVLKTITMSLLGLAWREPNFRDAGDDIRFFVAGVRFQDHAPHVQEGQPLVVRRDRYRNETCYEICADSKARIGYVPRQFARVVDDKGIPNARLEQHCPAAFPWKRYQVVLWWDKA